jgi:type III secretion system low calcium response chaperone LcrH/SycD
MTEKKANHQKQSNILYDAIALGVPFKVLLSDYVDVDVDVLMENLYKLASSLYEDGEYEKAGQFFGILCLLDYNEPKFSIGAGACMQELKKYMEANFCYTHATMLDADDPKPAFHAGECCLAINDTRGAIICYDFVVKSKNKDPHSKELRKQATHILKVLKKAESSKD